MRQAEGMFAELSMSVHNHIMCMCVCVPHQCCISGHHVGVVYLCLVCLAILCYNVGVQVSNWAGTAVLRRQNASAKPPPPERRSSVMSSAKNSVDRSSSQRSSKPPVLSPKPKLASKPRSSSSSRHVSNTASVSCDVAFPSPPPLCHDDTGLFYALCLLYLLTLPLIFIRTLLYRVCVLVPIGWNGMYYIFVFFF